MAGNLCNASPAADPVPAMIAANAVARVNGPSGERDCPVQDIPVAPGHNSLAKGEFITSILLPACPVNASDAYQRFIPHTEMDIAVVSAGVSLALDKDRICTEAQVAIGAVVATALKVDDAAACLIGTKLDMDPLDVRRKNAARKGTKAQPRNWAPLMTTCTPSSPIPVRWVTTISPMAAA